MANGKEIWSYELNNGTWLHDSVDLTKYAGQKVSLSLESDTHGEWNGREVFIDYLTIATSKDGSEKQEIISSDHSIAKTDATPKSSYTSEDFLKYVRIGNADKADVILKANPVLINTVDSDGSTALHYASAIGNAELTAVLLSHNAIVNAKKKDGVTPLHVAASLGKATVVKLLLSKGADPNAKDAKGRTPITLAKTKGFKSIVEALTNGSK